MKLPRAAAAVSLLLGLLPCLTVFTKAEKESIVNVVSHDKYRFTYFDDGRAKPYYMVFKNEDTDGRSVFKFDKAGFLVTIQAGTEKYAVRYNSDMSLKEVIRKDSGERMLLEDKKSEEKLSLESVKEDEEDNEDFFVSDPLRRRCSLCKRAWTAVCDFGNPSLKDLVSHPSLGAVGQTSVITLMLSLGYLCALYHDVNARCHSKCGKNR